jgi:hypothetical protein
VITVSLAAAAADRVTFTLEDPGAEPVDLTFRSSSLALRPSGDAALVAALPLAMRRGSPLHVDLAVSARLLAAVPTIQDVLAVWWRDAVSRVAVTSGAGRAPDGGDRHGGVVADDLESVHLALAPGAPDLLFAVRGPGHERPASTPAPVADGPAVTTDLEAVGARFGLDWASQYRGAAVAATAHLVADLGRVDLPAPFSVHYLFPWASHAVLDPLWSGEALEVRHRHADTDWIDRLRLVARDPEMLARVRPCDRTLGPDCGSCPGCLLFAAGLRVLGHDTTRSSAPDALVGLDLRHHTALADAAVLLRHADADADPALVGAVKAAIRRLGPEDVVWPDNWFASLAELGSARR